MSTITVELTYREVALINLATSAGIEREEDQYADDPRSDEVIAAYTALRLKLADAIHDQVGDIAARAFVA